MLANTLQPGKPPKKNLEKAAEHLRKAQLLIAAAQNAPTHSERDQLLMKARFEKIRAKLAYHHPEPSAAA